MHRCHLGVPALLCAALLGLALAACDRRVEPYREGESPREPDLSKIFPEGAEQSARLRGPVEEPPPPPGERAGPASGPPIRGTVRIATELQDRVPDDAVLFVIARPGVSGPPLAVKRIVSPRFPVDFALGPEDRMIQAIPFAGPLRVTARLDRDGNATTRNSGDLQGSANGTFDPGAQNIDLVLDELL